MPNQEPLPIRAARDPTPANIAKKKNQSGRIKNSNNNKSCNTISKGTCQSNNFIYCLECNWCHIKYVGQTKNRITDRFQGHIFDIKHNNITTMATHFDSYNDHLDPNMTIHILKFIRFPKDVPRSNSLRDNRELVWIHRLNTLIPNGLNILDWGNQFGREAKEHKEKAPCIFANITHVSRGAFPEWYPLAHYFKVIYPLVLPILWKIGPSYPTEQKSYKNIKE